MAQREQSQTGVSWRGRGIVLFFHNCSPLTAAVNSLGFISCSSLSRMRCNCLSSRAGSLQVRKPKQVRSAEFASPIVHLSVETSPFKMILSTPQFQVTHRKDGISLLIKLLCCFSHTKGRKTTQFSSKTRGHRPANRVRISISHVTNRQGFEGV